MTAKKHTKTPWRKGRYRTIVSDEPVSNDKSDDGGAIKFYSGNLVCESIYNKSDADFIVTACNAHDDLLAICKELVDVLTEPVMMDSGEWYDWKLRAGLKAKQVIENAESV